MGAAPVSRRKERGSAPKATSYRDLRALQDEWDRRLKAEGFNDLENRHFGAPGAPSWIDRPSSDLLRRYDPSAEEYYRAAQEFCDVIKDRPELVQSIWHLHADGMSQIQIMRALKLERRRIVRTQLEKLRCEMSTWWLHRSAPQEFHMEQSDAEIIEDMFAALSGVPVNDD